MNKINNNGWIELITGPMFCGKTEELIRRVNRLQLANKKYLAFKPSIDDRYGKEHITSHDNRKISCITVDKDIPSSISTQVFLNSIIENEYEHNSFVNFDAIIIDEIQFFDTSIVRIIEDLAYKFNLRVICAGMDMDFRSEPWPTTAILMSKAEYINKLQGICIKCGNPSTRTQRYVDGDPAKYDDPIILVGGKESYEGVCSSCYKVKK